MTYSSDREMPTGPSEIDQIKAEVARLRHARYPFIFNGDHADFERKHANTPPKERPDWPLPSFDARDWAEAFCKIAKQHGHSIDEEWMVTWFANALMRGYDEGAANQQSTRER